MQTKKELETIIEHLRSELDRRDKVLSGFMNENAVAVWLPLRTGISNNGRYKYVASGRDDSFSVHAAGPIIDAIKLAGVSSEWISGWGSCDNLNLSDHYGNGGIYLVPKAVADILVALLNGCARYGQDCYNQGMEDGKNVLRLMADGKVSADELEPHKAVGQACEVQGFRINPYKS